MVKMELTTLPAPSPSPCSPDQVAISPGDCVEGQMEWLEDEALPGFRVWQLAGIVLSILLAITVGFCCCVRFRIPRTKQTIEADYVRKKITKSFRRELSKISNTEMDEMDLRKALEKVRAIMDGEEEEEEDENEINKKLEKPTFKVRFNTMFQGMRSRLTQKEENGKMDNVI